MSKIDISIGGTHPQHRVGAMAQKHATRGESTALNLETGTQVQHDVVTQLDRCEPGLHGRWSIRAAAMLSRQIRQLVAGQQQLERAALAWRPRDESPLLQAQDHLMD